MKLEHITEALNTATTGTIVELVNYRDTAGHIKTLVVQLLDRKSGYSDLVRQSLEQIDHLPKQFGFTPNPDTTKALAKLKAQFSASLSGDAKVLNTNEVLLPHNTCQALEVSSLRADTLVLRHTRRITERTVALPPTGTTKESRRDPVNVECDRLKAMLPIGQYIGRFNLRQDNIENVLIKQPG